MRPGMSTRRYKRVMKELGMVVAIGVSRCAKAKHTMRTRYGHCVQCGTHNLAFLKRYENAGGVYVASSGELGLIKIGTAAYAEEREESLRAFGYGGGSDWKIEYKRNCDRAGRVEFIAHQSLVLHSIDRTYEKQGHIIDCHELFECDIDVAIAAIDQAVAKLGIE